MQEQNHTTLQGKFNPLIRPYLVLYGAFFFAITIVLIPLAIIWLCGLGQWWARHYFDKLECELSSNSLRFRKGILFQVEKTIPLENIQDVTFTEGPLLRMFNLSILKFETAGQSAGQAHDMRLIGLIDAHEFRNKILSNREALKLHTQHTAIASAPMTHVNQDQQIQLLKAILERLDTFCELQKNQNTIK
jgi:membrane protein YdbS with pleckstrin-like domain